MSNNNFVEKLKGWFGFDDGYDDTYEDGYEDGYEEETETDEESIEPIATNRKANNNKVVNIHTSSSIKVTITKPSAYEEVTEICDALKNRRIVLVNTTALDLKIAQRLLDFVGGSCYALEGELQQIEKGVYLISPSNVEVTNELKNEISSRAIFNWSK